MRSWPMHKALLYKLRRSMGRRITVALKLKSLLVVGRFGVPDGT